MPLIQTRRWRSCAIFCLFQPLSAGERDIDRCEILVIGIIDIQLDPVIAAGAQAPVIGHVLRPGCREVQGLLCRGAAVTARPVVGDRASPVGSDSGIKMVGVRTGADEGVGIHGHAHRGHGKSRHRVDRVDPHPYAKSGEIHIIVTIQVPIPGVGAGSGRHLERHDDIHRLAGAHDLAEIHRNRAAHAGAAVKNDAVIGIPGAGAAVADAPGFIEIRIDIQRGAVRIGLADRQRPVAWQRGGRRRQNRGGKQHTRLCGQRHQGRQLGRLGGNQRLLGVEGCHGLRHRGGHLSAALAGSADQRQVAGYHHQHYQQR